MDAMDFEAATPETIAEAIAEEIGRPVDYRPVECDGAARAASLIAEGAQHSRRMVAAAG
jgi:hypothetical protein